jgi:hypothetical protein
MVISTYNFLDINVNGDAMKIIKFVYKRYWKVIIPAVVTLIILLGAMFFESKDVFGYLAVDDEIKNVLDDYFKQRCSALITADITPVKGQFDLSSVYGKWSYEHEVKRIKSLLSGM